MKTSILALAIGVAVASPATAYADGFFPNIFETLFHGSDYSHRSHQGEPTQSAQVDPFKPRTTNGLSSNPDACASYGCVGAGGGGD
jgi:hypothetical protein